MSAAKKARRLVWPVLSLAAVAVVAWALVPAPVEVEVSVVSRGTLDATVSAEGKTRVKRLYEVAAPVDGTLERIELQPGDEVTEQSVVARIAPIAARPLDLRTRAEAKAAVMAARAAVARAAAGVREAEAAAEHAHSLLETARNLARGGAGPENAAMHAGHEAEIRERALDEARAAESQAQAELIRALAVVAPARGDAGDATVEVMPPSAGRVLRVLRQSGGPVAAGTPLIEVGDVTRLEVVADLLSSDAAEIRQGASTQVTGWGGPALRARVRRIEPAAFTKVSALGLQEQRVQVILDLVDPPPPNLGHDYRCDVAVVVWTGENVLRVPSTALFRQGDQWAVYAVEAGRARLATVAVGRSDATHTVIERGVRAGQVVVTQPSDEVRDDVEVRARNLRTAEP